VVSILNKAVGAEAVPTCANALSRITGDITRNAGNVFVFGSVHVTALFIRRRPQRLLKA
jgi:hypothetical protein